jgi:hypothetical protein
LRSRGRGAAVTDWDAMIAIVPVLAAFPLGYFLRSRLAAP